MIQDTIIAALSAELAQGNGQPLYRRLVSAIERLVADGHLKRGMLLPSERDLGDLFLDVSGFPRR